ncbi:hypothetical protein [Branchiibius cervicis]|uniref:ABC transporter permease n=1 Tax=Branchiibius cervicis TaxID=908252 RepID=A0ABW2AW25_9MICO
MVTAALRSLLARRARLAMSLFAVLLGVCFAFGSLIFISTLERAFSAVQSGTVSDVVVRQAGVRSGQGR